MILIFRINQGKVPVIHLCDIHSPMTLKVTQRAQLPASLAGFIMNSLDNDQETKPLPFKNLFPSKSPTPKSSISSLTDDSWFSSVQFSSLIPHFPDSTWQVGLLVLEVLQGNQHIGYPLAVTA